MLYWGQTRFSASPFTEVMEAVQTDPKELMISPFHSRMLPSVRPVPQGGLTRMQLVA